MPTTVNTYAKGLNKDVSKAKYSPENYYDALNIEVITNDGLSSYAVKNTKGTRLELTLPDIPEATYETNSENGTITIPFTSGNTLQIIGGTSYDNYLILFSTNNAGRDQIWRFGYNESTGLITSTELIYHRNLGFSINNRIKAFVRKESSVFIRLYWNDLGLNPMRSLNIAGSAGDIQLTRYRTIDINPKVNFELPILKEILEGNLPNGRIGYFYRLISKAGNVTTFSPVSNLVDLNNGNEGGLYQFYPDSGNDFKNDEAADDAEKRRLDFSSEKALRINIPSIDRDYDYIQIGYLLYEIENVPKVFLMPYDTLQVSTAPDKKYEFIHSGNEEGVYPITLEEFSALNNTFDSFIDFVPKHNELYIANIQNTKFDVDFDTRSYRFNNDVTPISRLYADTGGATLEFTIDSSAIVYPNTTTENELNLINLYNYEDYANWTTSQYKFKANGTSYGGNGPNISYTFKVHEHLVDEGAMMQTTNNQIVDEQRIAPFNKINRETVDTENFGIATQDYTGLSNSYSDLKSPYKSSIYESYARGEVYRFAWVGINSKGQETFAKWIGDIKFPFATDTPDDTNPNGYAIDRYDPATGNYYIRTLGIEFYVDNLPAEIVSWKIVRVERTEEDRTKLGTGVTGGFLENRADPFTIADLASVVNNIVADLISKIIRSAAGVWNWVPGTDTIADQIAGVIADVLTGSYVAGSPSEASFENKSPSDFKNIVSIGFGQLAGPSLGFSPVGILSNMFGGQLADWLYEKLKDFNNDKKVGGIDNIVYSLDNCIQNAATVTSEGTIKNNNFGYIISPIIQFDKYKFKNNDFLVPLASYEYHDGYFPKYVNTYHRDTDVGVLNRTHSTAIYKKWYYPDYITGDRTAASYLPIELENTLEIGEILVPSQITGFEGTIVNAYLGRVERLQDDGDYIGGSEKLSIRTNVLGIGDKKHFIKTTTNFPDLIDPVGGEYKIFDQEGSMGISNKDVDNKWYGSLFSLGPLYQGLVFPIALINTNTEVLTLTRPNSYDSSGNFLVSYERYIAEQYGGAKYTDRALNKYIPVVTVPESSISVSPFTVTCYGGDTYVGLYDSVNYAYYMEQIPGFNPSIETKKASGELFPAEAPFNFNVREGLHFNNAANSDDLNATNKRIKRKLRRAKRKSKRSGLDFNEVANIVIPKRFLYDSHIYSDVYHQKNTVEVSFPEPAIDIFTDKNTNRIYKSNNKLDGELIDSWKIFKPLNRIDVEGIYGPITSLHVNQDRLYFYQTNAFGIVTTNERASVQTGQGTMAVADSVSLSRYDYISTETGCAHTWGVVNTNSALYHFDINNKKLFQYSQGGLKPLSDIEGLLSYFKSNLILGNIITTDTTLAATPYGVHGVFDNVNNKVYFTFLNGDTSFTVNYNLLLQAFESFHSFKPGLYIRTPNKLFSVNPSVKYRCYQHNIGDYNSYYGTLYPSTISILTNPNPNIIKTFDNCLIFTEVTNSSGTNLVGETVSSIECINDHQQTGIITLTPGTNIRRIERKWNLQIPRDTTASAYTTLKARMSDTYMITKFTYNNTLNRRLVLHDIYTDFRESIT